MEEFKMATKVGYYTNKIASCIEKNFSFSVPDEDGTKHLYRFGDDWDKLRMIVAQIMEDKE